MLCLHGYRQNETSFREKSGALRKLLKKNIDFVFVTAPHVIPEEANLARAEHEQERGWWFSKPERGYNAMDRTDVCIGFEESFKLVQDMFESQGPFDGVLGFSQGAAFVSLLCVLRNDPSNKVEFKFAILIAGFQSLISSHQCWYSNPIDCPSFHTIGSTDGVIPTHSSEELLLKFVNGTAYRHNGGHYVPASPQLRTVITEFLSPFISE